MKFEITLGQNGTEKVTFTYDGFLGTINCEVDGIKQNGKFLLFGGKKKYAYQINNKAVDLVLVQPLFLALFRKRYFEVYIENKLYKSFTMQGKEMPKA